MSKLRATSIAATLLLASSAHASMTTREVGRSSNALRASILQGARIAVDHASDTIVHVYPHDITIWGGGSTEAGRIRYAVSTDGGDAFSYDLGVLNPTYTRPAYFPSAVVHNPDGATAPSETYLVWLASTRDPVGDYDGHVFGWGPLDASSYPGGTEQYSSLGADPATGIASGIVEGASGEFWWTDASPSGDISIYHAAPDFESDTGEASRVHTADPSYANFSASQLIAPNIAFSPDGSFGWVVWLSDLEGGDDDAYHPIVMASGDGGETWGAPFEVPLTDVTLDGEGTVGDALAALDDAASGVASTTFEFDLTVDAFGAPHIALVATNVSTPYSVSNGYGMFLIDLTTPDGGTTWSATKVADVAELRGQFGTPDFEGALLSQDNSVQVARDAAGEHLFFSWVDTTDPEAGGNVAPDLMIAGLRLDGGIVVGPHNLSGDDFIWSGAVLQPVLGPEVRTTDDAFQLPIVFTELITNDQQSPIRHHFVTDATITRAEFGDEPGDDVGDVDLDAGDAGDVDLADDIADVEFDAEVGEDVAAEVGEDAGSEVGEDVATEVGDDTTGEDTTGEDTTGEDVGADATADGSEVDASVTPGGGGDSDDESGCACTTGGSGSGPIGAAGVMLGLALSRRRRGA